MPVAATAQGVHAVVVTRDRCALLQRCLDAVLAGSRCPERIWVVDNASSDGTAALDWSRWEPVRVLRLERNLGGAGGFATGIAAALRDGARRLWLLDDDSLVAEGALQALLSALDGGALHPAPVLACSRVRWSDGRAHPMNLVAPRYVEDPEAFHDAVEQGLFPVRCCSFVSVLFEAALVAECGLPIADYVIWGDDIEYTARLLRHHPGVCVPASIVVHATPAPYGTLDAGPERYVYAVRNQLWTIRRSPAWTRVEKLRALLYLVWCSLRWLGRRRCRPVALAAVATGIARGLLGSPRQDPWGRERPSRAHGARSG